jgi:hypothetical protein
MGGDGKGHPLPASDEARHDEIPEELEAEKGVGDDDPTAVQPAGEAVNPDGEPYRYDDNGRAEQAGASPSPGGSAFAEDQRAHQDRGQSEAEAEFGEEKE